MVEETGIGPEGAAALAGAIEIMHNHGRTRDNPITDRAESVRQDQKPGFVHVTCLGKEYGPVREFFKGPSGRSTVLICTEDGRWWQLWYEDSDVKKLLGVAPTSLFLVKIKYYDENDPGEKTQFVIKFIKAVNERDVRNVINDNLEDLTSCPSSRSRGWEFIRDPL